MIKTIYKNINFKAIKNSGLKSFFKNDDIPIFHHIHKTAGTSVEAVLSQWYILHRDFNLEEIVPRGAFKNCHCISGHYGYHNIHLKHVFPNVFIDANFKVFTFVRDPLERSISHYYHWKNAGFSGYKNLSLESYLLGQAQEEYINDVSSNWMSKVLNLSKDNFHNILDSYFFIGVFENLQSSVDILANKLNRPSYKLPQKRKGSYKVSHSLSSEVIDIFRKRNEMDYKLYSYVLERFQF